jgi:chromate transporter
VREPGRRREVLRFFLWLGAVGFGGPSAHISIMKEQLVERRAWVDERRFLDLLGAANLIPGPTSSALAIHLGYERAGVAAGLLAGLGFYAPSFCMVLGLSWLYRSFGTSPVRTDLLAGVQAVIPAVILVTLWRLRAGIVGRRFVALGVAGLGLTLVEPRLAALWIVIGGLLGLAGRPEPDRLRSVAPVLIGTLAVASATLAGLPEIAWVFLRTGVLLFGGGLVLLPLLQPEVVARGWMTDRVFLDGIAIGQLTPGPVVIASTFIGFMVHGVAGAAVATASIVAPTFVLVLAGTGPLFDRFREDDRLRRFVGAVTATALGSVAASGLLLAPAALGSPLRAAIGAAALLALWRRVPIPLAIAAAALVSVSAGALT